MSIGGGGCSLLRLLAADQVQFNNNSGPQQIFYDGLKSVTLITGQAAISVHVPSTQQGMNTNVDLTHSPNPVYIGVYTDINPTLDHINGPLAITTNAASPPAATSTGTGSDAMAGGTPFGAMSIVTGIDTKPPSNLVFPANTVTG